MNGRTREGFYALWTIAILICLAVCIFVLAWVSIADGGTVAQDAAFADAQPSPSDAAQQDGASDAGSDVVLPGDGMTAAQDGAGQDGTEPAQDGTVPAQESTAPVQDATVPQQNVTPVSTVLNQTIDMGMDYQNRLVFLGDSTTYGLYSYGVLPHHQVWTPASGTLSLFNWAVETIDYYTADSALSQSLSISDCAATAQPEYLVITLGLNGISILDETQFKEYYTGLVQAIQAASPNTRIICQSIYPVIDAKTTDDIKNEKIKAANGWILDVATQTGTCYLNTYDQLTDDSGNLAAQYIDDDSDGIHMNANGYNAILEVVRTHAWQ